MSDLFSEIETSQPKQRVFIGIDNGSTGSIGIIKEDGTYTLTKLPVKLVQDFTKKKQNISRVQPKDLAKILAIAGPGSMIMIERPLINPSRFRNTMSAVRVFEATLIVIESLGLPYEMIDSRSWQSVLLPKGIKGPDLKIASLQVGLRLYPETKGIKLDERDGILIAHFCKQKHR